MGYSDMTVVGVWDSTHYYCDVIGCAYCSYWVTVMVCV